MNNLIEENTNKIIFWMSANKLKIVYFVLFSSFIVSISFLPYINLYLTKKFVLFLIASSFLLIFIMGWKKIMYMIFFLFFVVFILTLLKKSESVSIIGEFIYGFLVLALMDYIWYEK